MLHKIENQYLICTIESNGAEIRSLKNKATGEEYIWQIDKSVWGSSSPVLFPAIGKIKGDKILFKGKEYAMTKHGIIRHNDDLIFQQECDSKCSFTLNSSDKTLKKYPFQFSFTVSYELVDFRLIMTYQIENKDDIPMQFACGGHTAYACNLSEQIKLNDYVLDFPNTTDLIASILGSSGLLSKRKRKIEHTNGELELSETIFNEDALIFENIIFDSVRLRKKDETKGIVVQFKGYPNLALWSKPKADYVCIEPWLGLPDREVESLDITEKSTYKTIEPNTTFSIAIETIIE